MNESENSINIQKLTLDQKLGQMIWCPFFGQRSSEKRKNYWNEIDLARDGLVGGVVVQEGDLYESAILLSNLHKTAAFPMVVAADVERGLGSLLNDGTKFPSNMAFGATRSAEYGYLAGKIAAEESAAIGINVVLGPTCTRAGTGLTSGLPLVRSHGEKLHLVSKMSNAFIRGVHAGGLLSTPRYFPGSAEIYNGTYTGARWVHHLKKLLIDSEIGLYDSLSQAGLGALMIDWREMPDMITDKVSPAMTNVNLIEKFLREVLGYRGLVITPNLSKRALTEFVSPEVMVSAVLAGVDVLCGVPDPVAAREYLKEEVIRERIPLSRIDQAVERISVFKSRLKEFDSTDVTPEKIEGKVATSANIEVAKRVAEDSITLLRDRSNILPLDPGSVKYVLNISFCSTHTPELGAYLDESLRSDYDHVISRVIDNKTPIKVYDDLWREVVDSDVVLMSMFTNRGPDCCADCYNGDQRSFIERIIGSGMKSVMASFGDPRVIKLFPEVECYLCLYSDSMVSQRALVRDLSGELVMPIKGKLPINLEPDYPYGFGLDLT